MIEGRDGIGMLFLCGLSISIAPGGGQNTPSTEDHLRPLIEGAWHKTPAVPASPDPAIAYQWASPPNDDAELQLLTRDPVEILGQQVTESIDVGQGADEHLITMYFTDWESDDREVEI